MNVLVLGGTRFIGKAIAHRALEAGHRVTLFNRRQTAPTADAPVIEGDIAELSRHSPELLACQPEVVVHAISHSEKNAEDAVDVFRTTGARILVLSSQDCYEAFQQAVREREVSDYPIREDAPLSSVRFYKRGIVSSPTAESYDKNLMTDVFLRAFARGQAKPTIFRLPMVYGPGDYQFEYRHGGIIRRIADRQRTFAIGLLDQATIWTFGYVENVAAAVVHAFTQPATIGRVYNLGETSVRSKRRWADLYARQAGVEFEYAVLPDEILARDATIRNHPPGHLIMNCTRYAAETGFREPVSFEAGIEKTLSFGLEHLDVLGPPPDYSAEARSVAEYGKIMADLQDRTGA